MKDEKIKRLREIMPTTPSLCTERAYLLTQSYRETEGQSEVIRRAKALAKILSEMTVYVELGKEIRDQIISRTEFNEV